MKSVGMFFGEIAVEIQINDRDLSISQQDHDFTLMRLQFALGRFTSRIRNIAVTFSDQNGPRGGQDIQCRVRIMMEAGEEIVVTNVDSSLEACVAHAADRAGRTVARFLERHRQHQGMSMSGDQGF